MSIVIGLLACGISILFFGSMFVPLKQFDGKDGIFTQWLMSVGILLVGFVAFAFSGFPGFYPLAMLGGVSWAIGNATAIPIISRLGMAISILIWNTTNCLTGWAGGRFGLFGMKANIPASPLLNYLGLIGVVMGGLLFSRVQSVRSDERSENDGKKKYSLVGVKSEPHIENSLDSNNGTQRSLAVIIALIAGLFYGMMFVPVIYMIENPEKYPNYPSDGLSYAFSHYFGIFVTSTIIFITYSIIKKNNPYTPSSVCLPAILSGSLWAVAHVSFFVANQHLSQAVTFPIISMVPGCIASAWSIFYYKEIRGRQNFIYLSTAMIITLGGAILVGLSKTLKL